MTEIIGYDPRRMALIGSDLFGAKHKESGLIIMDIDKEWGGIIFQAENSGISAQEVEEADSLIQEKIRRATPSFLSLLSLKLRI